MELPVIGRLPQISHILDIAESPSKTESIAARPELSNTKLQAFGKSLSKRTGGGLEQKPVEEKLETNDGIAADLGRFWLKLF